MVDANVAIISELKQFLEEVSTNMSLKQRFVEKLSDFSRERVLTFKRVVGLLINMPKRSLSIEVREFFANLSGDETCNKSAFCMQRGKLKPSFFQEWLALFVKLFYHHYGDKVQRWRGFLIQAVDGSTTYLVNKQEVIEHFGTQDNQFTSIPMAQVVQIHDVLNDITIWGDIYPIKTSEQSIIAKNLHYFSQNSIALFDRGYPSYGLIYLLEKQSSLFVMRAKVGFNKEVKEFMESPMTDTIAYFTPNNVAQKNLQEYGYNITCETKVKVRLVKIKLDSGETEVLITNLYDEQLFSIKDLSYLYSLRWGIETCYGKEKNQQQLEIFSGHRVICIYQDYYATLFVANIQSLIEKQSKDYLSAVSKRRTYQYKINRNVSWSVLKNTIFKLFIEEADPKQLLLYLQHLFEICLEPVRPNRKVKRVKKNRRMYGKYQTVTNYKRAI